ncbi:MAG: iron-containing alcohol dehydrogenase [Lentisphaeria bacterium]|nr:iron-containing alcohol dehydrogenase [Lentisphaeria bacterium]
MQRINIPRGMETAFFVMEENALRHTPEILRTEFPGRIPWIVADENTFNAAGKQVLEYLDQAGMKYHDPMIYPGTPVIHGSEDLAQALSRIVPENAVPVAVGSGTINDLVKRASELKKVRYCCIPTACSVDGYTSKGAALLVNGAKKTMPCAAPYGVIADTKVLATAPAPMMAAGYADLLAKVYGGADWVIVDELGLEKIDRPVWDLVQKELRAWLSDCKNLGGIFHGLCNTGYSMQLYNDSRPASGAEHLFSHVWEMESFTCNGESVSHGFQVGIGMLISASLMKFLIDHDVDSIRKMASPPQTRCQRMERIDQLLVKGCYGATKETAMEKFLEGDALLQRRELIYAHWEEMRRRVKEQYIELPQLRSMLKNAACPYSHRQIGMSDEQYLHVVETAQLIRKRYTILDLLYESGVLPQAVSTLLALAE